ncbi:MAG: prolipoprotein diacylglyceryl transferase [Chlamydiales bacterium]
MISWLSWNPSRVIFYLPIIHHPITWYGVILALGYGIGYRILAILYRHYSVNNVAKTNVSELSTQLRTQEFCEAISMYCLFGILLGARIGHILFYENIHEYVLYPLRIFMTWKGGISSHGAIVGAAISIASYLYRSQNTKKISFLQATDLLVIPLTLGMAFVRLGNFINQEAVGVYTSLPWGIVFENPFIIESVIPRHPVQIYEAIAYVGLFYFLYKLYRKNMSLLSPGKITSLFLSLCFTMRFLLEYLKEEPLHYLNLSMGQWLSIPFIIIGAFILIFQKNFVELKNR